ncbi:hypothetical protein COU61_02670 [Candidatus Pacearchaeota archaeon CG10_big_fil_rev_8_21_14_0_10_35_13]|nr:MAG: hypothetical protein COU61_02670 [Candidatus Pacearchaeota archaeon CG10_big_fil_rev_8_21_14_0_10_35_13]
MKVKLDHPKILSDIVGIISELVLEVRFRFDASGMNVVAIDPANVALTALNIPASSFSQYEVNNENIGISLESLKAVLRRTKVGSSIVMQTEENNLKIEINDKIKRTFRIALIDIEGEQKEIPSLEFSNEVEMSAVDFSEAIEDCKIVADSCRFEIKGGMFVIEASGLNSVKLEFSNDEAKISGEEKKSKYSLEYLQKFSRACKLTDKVKMNFSSKNETDYPLRLEFIIGRIGLIFILAPRVETED